MDPRFLSPYFDRKWSEELIGEVILMINESPHNAKSQECLRVIRAADALIALLDRVGWQHMRPIRVLASAQCTSIYYDKKTTL
jgi:hypothetical protein